MKILVTGAAGFIGSKLCYLLAKRGDEIIGLDNLNNYYDVRLKYGRLATCGIQCEDGHAAWGICRTSSLFPNYRFIRMDITDKPQLDKLFADERFDKIVNLAAQAGVRYSITNPYTYIESNIVGFLNILEACRHYEVRQLVYASSSVYGMNDKVPFSEEDVVTTPVSLYAASKKSNELLAHSYSKLYNLPTTGLRYFTVYGPWGRPDMAPMLFANAISREKPINVFNNGEMVRDFTYIDDIAEGTMQVIDHCPDAQKCANHVPYKIYNIGCSHPVQLMDFIQEIESALHRKAIKNYMPMQLGDVYKTYADTTKLETEINYKPKVELHDGIRRFIDWYLSEENPIK